MGRCPDFLPSGVLVAYYMGNGFPRNLKPTRCGHTRRAIIGIQCNVV